MIIANYMCILYTDTKHLLQQKGILLDNALSYPQRYFVQFGDHVITINMIKLGQVSILLYYSVPITTKLMTINYDVFAGLTHIFFPIDMKQKLSKKKQKQNKTKNKNKTKQKVLYCNLK